MGIRLRGGTDLLPGDQPTLIYDEVGGAPWEEKKPRIAASHARVVATIERLGLPWDRHLDEYDVFHIARLGVAPAEARRLLRASLAATPRP
jgi:hypothetical protein